MQEFIPAVSCSRKMVATKSAELWDTMTWEVVRHMDNKSHVEIAFSPDENQVAIWSDSPITLWDINNPENGLSFDPWSTERHVFNGRVAFQTSNHGVICAELWRDNHVFVCSFSLDIKTPKYSEIFLALDGLTIIISNYGSYSWNNIRWMVSLEMTAVKPSGAR